MTGELNQQILIDKMTVGVIIPAFNEALSIKKVVQDLPKNIIAEIVVVNNGSTDDTAKIAEQNGAVVLTENRRGYGWACLKGMEYLKKKDIEIVVFLDGDYSDDPKEITQLIEPIKKNECEFVVGSRVLGKRQKGSLKAHQIFGNKLATFLIRVLFGGDFTDLGPFRAIKHESLSMLSMKDKTYGWTVEMQIKAVKQRLKYMEVPVNYKPRIGKSKVSGTIKGSIKAGTIILFWIFKSLFK